MTPVKISQNGSDIQCGRCSVKLADLVVGPLERFVAEPGGPAIGTYVVRVGERSVLPVSGYWPREPDGLWVLTGHAQRRIVKAKRDGRAMEPEFADGDARNGIVEFPARVLCFRCGATCLITTPA